MKVSHADVPGFGNKDCSFKDAHAIFSRIEHHACVLHCVGGGRLVIERELVRSIQLHDS